jgi:hypothetical protein
MVGEIRSKQWIVPIIIGAILLSLLTLARPVAAINPLPTPPPIPGSIGLEATKPKPPPDTAATISTPGNGASYTTTPITVAGICPNDDGGDLLIQVYDNDVMVGAVMCKNNSWSLQVSLFAGTNVLTAIDFDVLGQAGPVSNSVTVSYNDLHLTAFGQLVTLTSSYGRRSAAAGAPLSWPLQLSGGTGPYAFSIDWGDGSAPELKSQSLAGVVTISHVYSKAGIYQPNVKVTDTNGVSAFLQLVAVANGKVDSSTAAATDDKNNKTPTTAPPQILWVPTVVSLLLLIPSFLLGRLSQVVSLRNRMLKERDNYKSD